MLYLDIIINEFKDILFFENYIFTFLYILLIIWFIFINRNIFFLSYIAKIAFLLRLILIVSLTPLLNNNIFNKVTIKEDQQKFAFIIDNSLSIQNIIKEDSLDFNKYLKKIDDWANSNAINSSWFNLDSIIKSYDSITFNRKNTTFSNIKNIIHNNDFDQLFIISDGVINTETLSNDLSISKNIKIHTIGLGQMKNRTDISIRDVSINNKNDSLYVNTILSIDIDRDSKYSLSLNSKNNIFIDTINAKKGKYLFEKLYVYNNKNIYDDIKIIIDPIDFVDLNKHNNKWHITNNNKEELNVLLISSALSYNTMFIKNILNSIDYINSAHIYKKSNEFNINSFNVDDYDYFILDNFPNNQDDFMYLKEIFAKEKSFLFIEGFNFNPKYLINFLNQELNTSLTFNNSINSKSFKLNNQKLVSDVLSHYNLFKKDNNYNDETLYYSDNSIFQINKFNFLGLFIPNLSQISFYLSNRFNDKSVDNYLKYLIDIHFERNSLYAISLNKKNYLLGDKLNYQLSNKLNYQISDQKFIIKNIDTFDIDTINYIENMDIFLPKAGNYEIYTSYKGTNSNQINSNKEIFYIEEYMIETSQNFQNMDFLKSIASKYGGFYTDINNLNDDWLSLIDVDKYTNENKKIFSALEIFIKEKIYLILIFLFCLEIYLRKKIGLL